MTINDNTNNGSLGNINSPLELKSSSPVRINIGGSSHVLSEVPINGIILLPPGNYIGPGWNKIGTIKDI